MQISIKEIRQNQLDFANQNYKYIPLSPDLEEFSKWYPGMRKGEYILFTGGTSSGKTQITKYFCLFGAIEYFIKHKKKGKILWFGLEEGKKEFEYSILSYLLYKITKKETNRPLRYNVVDFEAIGNRIPESDLEAIERCIPYVEKYLSYVEFFSFENRVEKVIEICNENLLDNGRIYLGDKVGGKDMFLNNSFDRFEWNDPESFNVLVFDHFGLVDGQLHQEMGKLSKAWMRFASKFDYITAGVIQQMAAMEDIEHLKEHMMYASLQGFGDNKTIGRDAKTIIGITNVFRYGASTVKVHGGDNGSEIINLNLAKAEIGPYCRVLGILKQRYGLTDIRMMHHFDGKSNFFESMNTIEGLTECAKLYR